MLLAPNDPEIQSAHRFLRRAESDTRERDERRDSMAVPQQTPQKPARRHKRFNTRTLQVDNPVAGQVLNVCRDGFALESPERLTVGTKYAFTIRRGSKQLRISGRVQWCRFLGTGKDDEGNERSVYQAGIALADSVGSKAWQAAVRRMTEQPTYVIWHRSRGSKGSLPAVTDETELVVRLRSEARPG